MLAESGPFRVARVPSSPCRGTIRDLPCCPCWTWAPCGSPSPTRATRKALNVAPPLFLLYRPRPENTYLGIFARDVYRGSPVDGSTLKRRRGPRSSKYRSTPEASIDASGVIGAYTDQPRSVYIHTSGPIKVYTDMPRSVYVHTSGQIGVYTDRPQKRL